MRRRYRWILTTLVTGLVLSGLTVVVLLYTTFGLSSIVLPTVSRLSGMDVQTTGLKGSVAAGLQADTVTVSGPGLRIALSDLLFEWELWELLGSHVIINALSMSSLSIQVESTAKADERAFEPPTVDLPVSISIQQASIGSIELNDQLLGSLTLQQTDLADRRLTIAGVTARSVDRQALELQGWLETAPPYRHQLEASASLKDPAPSTLALSGSMSEGTLDLSAPSLGLQMHASYEYLLSPDRAYDITATASEGAPITGNVHIRSAENPPPDALTAFTVNAQVFQGEREISLLDLDLVARSTQSLIVTGGEVLLDNPGIAASDLRGEVTAQGLDLQLAIAGEVENRGLAGTVAATGTWQEIALQSSGTVADLGDWQMQGTVTPQALTDAQLHIQALAGKASLRGRVAWSPSLDFDWSGEISDMAMPDPVNEVRVEGISGNFTVSGSQAGVNVQLPALSALIDGRPLTVDGNAELAGNHLTRAELNARSGTALAQAVLVWPVDAALPRVDSKIQIPLLGDFIPGAGGRIMADISTEDGRQTQVDANLSDIRYGSIALDDAKLTGEVELQAPYAFEAITNASGLSVDNEPLGSVSLAARGRPDDFTAAVALDATEQRAVQLSLDAGWSNETLSGELTSARLAADGLDIALASSTPFTVTANSGSIERFCLVEAGRGARLCLSAAMAPEQRRLTAELISLSTRSLLEFAPLAVRDQLAVEGNLSGHAIVVLYPDAPSALSMSINADSLEIGHPSERQIEGLKDVAINASLSGDTSSTDLRVSVQSDALTAAGSGEVSGWLEPPLQWQAEGSVNVPSLTPFSIWLGGDRATGEVDASILASKAVDGEIPQIEGSIRISRLGLEVPAAETRITDGEVIIEFPDTRSFRLRGELPLPGGTLTARGKSEFDKDGLVNPDFRIRGEAVTLVDNAQIYLVASPDLRIRKPADQLTIGGRVAFEQVRVLLDTLESSNIVTPSRDVIIKGEEETMNEGIVADVTLDIRKGATVRGRGLDATVSGSLRVQQNPGQPPRATGELMVNGTYKAYGQDLTVTDGRLTYSSSPLDNPGIAMTAMRSIEDVEVGVQVSGTALEPRVELISNSGLSDVATLSYLLFGRPPDRTSVGESDSLTQAALLAALGRTSEQTQSFGQKLGLDELSFSASSDLGGAAVSLGRYLAPNLYLGYSIGLVSGSELIELRYELTRRWTLRTEVGEESRASVRYRFIQPDKPVESAETADEASQDDNDS